MGRWSLPKRLPPLRVSLLAQKGFQMFNLPEKTFRIFRPVASAFFAAVALSPVACGESAAPTGSSGDNSGSIAGSDARGGSSESADPGGDADSLDSDGEEGSCQPVELEDVKHLVTDTMQSDCYDTRGQVIDCPASELPLSGQDAQHSSLPTSYENCSGIVTDLNTGLMWEQAHHDERVSYPVAAASCESLELGGYADWRIPSIRELFSINDARGDQHETGAFYLDAVFDFAYPTDVELTGSHLAQMMGQTWSSTPRPDNERINYFYNFLDGHIKSQFNDSPNSTLFYRCVRGDASAFQESSYTDHDDGTVSDDNTGLMWQQANAEDGPGDFQFNWSEALEYCESLSLAGHEDWMLPDIKQLLSIVDYEAPDYASTNMVLDTSVFSFDLPSSKDLNTPPTTSPPNGDSVAPFFWSSTTHGDAKGFASYVCFGPCWAVEVFPGTQSYDAHGPGAQRADPKSAPPSWPTSIGDQKDVVQVENFVRCVREDG